MTMECRERLPNSKAGNLCDAVVRSGGLRKCACRAWRPQSLEPQRRPWRTTHQCRRHTLRMLRSRGQSLVKRGAIRAGIRRCLRQSHLFEKQALVHADLGPQIIIIITIIVLKRDAVAMTELSQNSTFPQHDAPKRRSVALISRPSDDNFTVCGADCFHRYATAGVRTSLWFWPPRNDLHRQHPPKKRRSQPFPRNAHVYISRDTPVSGLPITGDSSGKANTRWWAQSGQCSTFDCAQASWRRCARATGYLGSLS